MQPPTMAKRALKGLGYLILTLALALVCSLVKIGV